MRKVDELSDEYEPREPFLEHEPTSHAAERLRIFAGATLAVALLFGGLLTYRLLGIADCNASLTGYNTARQYAVLLTGFGPYGNYTQNPTELIVQALNGSCRNGVCFYSHVLPVTDAGTWDAERLIVQAAPQDDGAPLRGWDCVLHLGYEDHARGLKLETVAKNVRAQQGGVISADYGDACTTASLIYPDSPCLLPTTAPLDRISLPGVPVHLHRADSRAHALQRTAAIDNFSRCPHRTQLFALRPQASLRVSRLVGRARSTSGRATRAPISPTRSITEV